MMYSGSSQSSYSFSSNGTHPIKCYECQLVIGETAAPFGQALCEVCQRALAGTPMTPEQIAIYKESKERFQSVGMVVVHDEPQQHSKFSLRSLGGDLLSAIGLPKPKPKAPKSKTVIETKKREGLFRNVDFNLDQLEEKKDD